MIYVWISLHLLLVLGCSKTDMISEDLPPTGHDELEWIHFDSHHFRYSDGRQFIVRGLDYKYNTVGYTDTEFDLVQDDFKRMATWGVNVLRVRLSDTRSGWYPHQSAEPGYLDGLDNLVRMANLHGIYVIIATNGAEQMLALYERPNDLLYEQAKFLPGTEAHEHWLNYMSMIFDRYKDVPGVLGFDAINEDFSFPPEVHDKLFMKEAHELLLARLRAVDSRHIYFQQPAGWDYSPDLSVSMGHPLPDQNRVFGTKWFAMQNQELRMQEMLDWAEEANTPLFICETWVWDLINRRPRMIRNIQRETLNLLDKHTVGWISLGYLPLVGLIREDRKMIHLMDEWIRPYPQVVGGTLQSLNYEFDKRQFNLSMQLDESGDTEIFIPAGHTYPEGFQVEANKLTMMVDQNGQVVSQTGAGILSWNKDAQKLIISPVNRQVDLIIEAMDPGPVPQSHTRLDYSDDDFPPQDEVVRPVFTLAEGENSLRERILSSGDWTEDQVNCVIENWKSRLEPIEWEIVARAGLMQVDMRIRYTIAIFDCLEQ